MQMSEGAKGMPFHETSGLFDLPNVVWFVDAMSKANLWK